MGKVSVNSIHKGLIELLYKTFNHQVYGDEIAQGFIMPCFFVSLIDQSEERHVGRRYKRTHRFDVHYFPAKGREEAFDMADKLYNLLALIPINGDLYRGSGMNMRYIDDVLHFFVDYNLMVDKPTTRPPRMGKLERKNIAAKG